MTTTTRPDHAAITAEIANDCAAEHIAQGWTVGSAAYSIAVYTGDREALADALGRDIDCGEAMDFEAMVRAALDAAMLDARRAREESPDATDEEIAYYLATAETALG